MLLERLLGNLSVAIEPFAVCEVESGCRLALDERHSATVHFVLSGSGTVRAGRSVVAFAPNTLIVVPQRCRHELKAETDGGRVVEHPIGRRLPHLTSLGDRGRADVVTACGRLDARFGGGPALFELLREPIAIDFSESSEMISLFDSILAESSTDEPGSEAMLGALMSRCLVMLFRRLCDRGDCPLPWLNALEDDRIAAALDLMLDAPEADHSVESLAHAAAMSRTAFSQRFRDAFGSPPMTFLREIRLRLAADLLGDVSVNVSAVAGKVGFHSRAHFSTAFRERFGITPGAYREQMLAAERSEPRPPLAG